MVDFHGRKYILSSLVGSHNYNLNDETSDRDYKYFVAPTLDDLYNGNFFVTQSISDDFDYDIHDVRKLSHLFWKANINFIEILYSKDLYINPEYPEIKKLFNEQKCDIVKMNLPYLYNACKGMHYEKMSRLEKGTESTMKLVEKFGYDTKQACHAYRVLDFITRYADSNLLDFQGALWYDNGKDKDSILDIKHGKYTLSQYKELIGEKLKVFSTYDLIYMAQKPNIGLKEYIDEVIKKIIFRSIYEK